MKSNLEKYIIGFVVLVFIVLIIGIYKTNKEEYQVIEDANVVAKIDGEEITVHDLKMNYEFGYSHLKKGNTPRERIENYLNLMINEKLISLKGYEIGVDENEEIAEWENKLKKELVLEKLIDNEIANRIEISEEEIRDEVNKSKVSFKLRYWAEPTIERVEFIKSLMDEKGYAEVVDEINNLSNEVKIDPKKLETDYLTNTDISPEILFSIKDLPAGKISDPVLINGNYFLFQIIDIRRKSVTTNEYKSKASSVYNSLYHTKLQSAVIKYVDSLLTPKKISTKRKGFELLLSALIEWKNTDTLKTQQFSEAVHSALNNSSNLFAIKESLNDTIVYYDEGYFTFSDLLSFFQPSRIKAETSNRKLFRNQLNTLIAISVRDELLYDYATTKGFDTNDSLNTELKKWKDQWVFQLTRNKFLEEVDYGNNSSLDENEKKQILNNTFSERIESLRKQYNVTVNQSILDTLNTIEFEKSKWASVQVYKGGTGRPVTPLVDPSWDQLINN